MKLYLFDQQWQSFPIIKSKTCICSEKELDDISTALERHMRVTFWALIAVFILNYLSLRKKIKLDIIDWVFSYILFVQKSISCQF